MSKATDNLPLDARLLSDAIIELNISRHNVSIYHKNHPIVKKSLDRAFDFLQRLFELRKEIALAVAKDILIIDSFYLDKKNPVYKEFARRLSKMNVAYVTFINGLTKDELYSFHQFISENVRNPSPNDVNEMLKKYTMPHIRIAAIDFSAFKLVEGRTDRENRKAPLWEQYVFEILEGRLQDKDASDFINALPPGKLAETINKADSDNIKEESYDRIIASYVKKSSERAFSGRDLKKLMDFIDGLRPELKRHFLASMVGTLSKDLNSVERLLHEMSADDVINLLGAIDEQMTAIPEALKNVLDKFSSLHHGNSDAPSYNGKLVEDDILLSPEITTLLDKADFNAFVSDSYQREIQSLLKFDAEKTNIDRAKEIENELNDEHIEKGFHQIVLELISSYTPDIVPEEEIEFFINILKYRTEQLIDAGRYQEVLETYNMLESSGFKDRLSDSTSDTLQSPNLISSFINSLRITGKEMRGDVFLLCEHYGENLIPPLMDALIDEESLSIRKFIIGLITHFGKKAVPEAVKRLDDGRWFVKRNMLYILNECGGNEALQKAREYCNHENPKVSLEAVKYLLKANDGYGIKSLKKHLKSGSGDSVRKAIVLSGAYGINDVVPDLIRLLEKKAITVLNFDDRISIVKALGQIGDPRAIDTLYKLLSVKTLFFKGSLEKLKKELKKTLKKFASKEINDPAEKSGTHGKTYK